MADIRDLILEELNSEEKIAEVSSNEEHIKVAEQLEALSTDDSIVEDLLKVAIWEEIIEHIKEGDNDNKNVDETSS